MESEPSIPKLITDEVVNKVRSKVSKFPYVVEVIANQVVPPGASFDQNITTMKAVRNALIDLLGSVDGV